MTITHDALGPLPQTWYLGTYPLLLTFGGHDWRLVHLRINPLTSTDTKWWPPKRAVRILLESILHRCIRFSRFSAFAITRLSTHIWYHVTGSYHRVDGASIWVNGIPEKLNAREFAHAGAVTDVDWGAAIGVRDTATGQRFPMKGYVDDFKYHYKVLTSAGKYIYPEEGLPNPPVCRQMLLKTVPSLAVGKNIGKKLSRDKEQHGICHPCSLLVQGSVYS